MKSSLLYRFLHEKLEREELKNLRDEVNQNEQGTIGDIQKDWENFVFSDKVFWPDKHWQQIETKINPGKSNFKEAKSSMLPWWTKVAATVLIAVGVWYGLNTSDSQSDASGDFPVMITKVNDADQPAIMLLKDGTKVTLSAHSKLSYYDNFNAKYRVVHLEGEAIFETDQGNSRPFVVVSDNITSICRGKEFSISAFKESDEINVTLASGQIEIAQNDRLNSESNKVAVKSCQRYSFNKSNHQYLIGQISECDYNDKVQSMKINAGNRVTML